MLVIAHRGHRGTRRRIRWRRSRKPWRWERRSLKRICSFRATRISCHSRRDGESNHQRAGSRARHEAGGIAALDAGSWFGSEFAGERIPTLEEILEFSKKYDVVFYLEIKPVGSWGGEHALVAALRESGEIPRTVVISLTRRSC